ncbi:MAG: zinc-binding alcohol dehydrogenase family protein [Burkholderiaceae bacterium]
MKAVAYLHCLPVEDPACLVDVTLPTPEPGPRDLRVRVRAVSVNPVDTKLRRHAAPADGQPRVLGFDVAGVVEAVGAEVTGFAPGDEVWYAGARTRQGGNAEWHCVDERLVGRKPRSLDFAQAAAMPLTTITAWESLFDRLQLRIGRPADPGTVLITAGAGGVGSMAIQLAKRLTGARVIATASRPESRAQAERLGADVVLDHSRPLSPQLKDLGIRWVEAIFSVSHTDQHFAELAKVVAPFGRLCVIDETGPIDVRLLKARSASLHWEGMFTRSGFELPDIAQQGRLLTEVAGLVDGGLIRSTHARTLGRLDAATLREAHALVESNRMIGKVVLDGY